MAINPATGLEDPNYTPPVEEPTVPEEPATGLLGVPPLELSDQEDKMQGARDNISDTVDWAQDETSQVDTGDVSYAPVDADKLIDEAGIKEGSSYATPESTVAGQLTQLLDSDSKYMKTAERRADEKSARLGLLGSSMAVGAAHRAAIESAMPIAQQDAKTYAQFQLNEQQTKNEVSRIKAESDLSAAAREHMYDIDAEKMKFNAQIDIIASSAKQMGNAEVEMALTQAKATWDAETKAYLAEVDANLTMKMNQQEISAREREYASTTSSQIMAASYGTINDLMGNADFMAGYADNPDGLTKVFNNFINLAKDQVRFIGATAGLTEEYSDPNNGYLEFIGEWTAAA